MHRLGGDALGDEGLADAARQDEGQRAALHFLVLKHGVETGLRAGVPARDVGDAGGQAHCAQMTLHAFGVLRRAMAELGGEAIGAAHADGDAFAVVEAGGVEVGEAFEGVAEVWFDNAEEFTALLDLPYVQEHVLIDEERFIDRANTKYFMAEEEVIASGPRAGEQLRPKTETSLYDLEWSDNNRANTIKLLQFIVEDGTQVWAAPDDAELGHRIGALRHVRNHPIGDNPYIGLRELSWPTLTAFERGIATGKESWATLRDRPRRSFSLLVYAERRV